MTEPSLLRPLLRPLPAALLVAAACTRSAPPATVTPEPAGRSPATVLPHPALTQAGVSAPSIADIAERVTPAVVNISLTKVSSGRSGVPFFFGPFGPGHGEEREQQGMGSGVIVDKDGTVLTNNHVVADAKLIKVTLADKREFDAEVVGTDPKSDVAVIKIKDAPTDLYALEIGDSSRIRLGDVVLAIGNPFGVGQTVTMGIVSAKGRADVGIVDYEDFIQTDAAINPGNSGGALVNMEGSLIGINTAILSRSGGYQGVGFAIPTNMAKPIMDSLKRDGRVVRGWLGVSIQDMDQELATTMKLPTARGVLIADVQVGSPAAKAGLKRGDVVVKVDGVGVESTGQFRNAIAIAGSGREVKLELYREGKPQTLKAALGEAPDTTPVAEGGRSSAPSPTTSDGLSLGELTPEVRRRLNVGNDVQRGVAVLRIAPGSAAARSGLRPGDVVLEVDRKPVGSVKEFQELYGKAKGNVLLLVHRRGATLFLVVRR